MLTDIHPLLTGDLLRHLDAMGHSDAVVVADAHFPCARLAQRMLVLPGLAAPHVLEAIRTVVPLDEAPALDLMGQPGGGRGEVQRELMEAADVGEDGVRDLERQAFYDAAAQAYLVIRTGERRVYGNAILRKGVVTVAGEH